MIRKFILASARSRAWASAARASAPLPGLSDIALRDWAPSGSPGWLICQRITSSPMWRRESFSACWRTGAHLFLATTSTIRAAASSRLR